jgi:hypothetical protein
MENYAGLKMTIGNLERLVAIFADQRKLLAHRIEFIDSLCGRINAGTRSLARISFNRDFHF